MIQVLISNEYLILEQLLDPNYVTIIFYFYFFQECSSIDPEAFLKKRNEVKERSILTCNSSPDPE